MNRKFLASFFTAFAITTNALPAANDDSKTILHTLAMSSNYSSLMFEISKNKNLINSQDNAGRTPLNYACLYNRTANALLLLSSEADPNIADHDGLTPLHRAAFNGLDTLIADLVSHGGDCNATTINGGTPLHLAVQKNHFGCVKKLLACNGIDLTLTLHSGDFKDLTAQALAQKLEYRDLIKLFKEKNNPAEQTAQSTAKKPQDRSCLIS